MTMAGQQDDPAAQSLMLSLPIYSVTNPQSAQSANAGRSERMRIRTCEKRLGRQDESRDLTKYLVILILISLVPIAAMKLIGSTIHEVYSNASSNTGSASSGELLLAHASFRLGKGVFLKR